jgi:phosphoglucosamine mutase
VLDRFGSDLGGMRVAVDCANGAFSGVAPDVLERLGAEVTAVANAPDGANINAGCGATDLSLLSEVVRGGSFDLGVAFDGDGDRMLAVDETGSPVDGDQILAVLALAHRVDRVAVTVMTNMGFHRLMAENGVSVHVTDVGDRYVLEAMREHDVTLGGEQSGHLIWLDGHVTGDGLVAALLLCRAVAGGTLSSAAAAMPRYPQAKVNVPAVEPHVPERARAEVDRVNEELGVRGRVLVRPSGTEPLVRVLAEAEDGEEASGLCASIAELVRRELANG